MLRSRPRRSALIRAGAAAVVAASVALLLGGCVGVPGATAAPTAAPSASPSPEPIFASDEEALAAAVEAYERYLRVSQVIGEEGGANPGRILSVVTPEYAEVAIAGFEGMATQDLRIVGENTFSTKSLIEHAEQNGTAVVSIYACVGVGTTRILDAGGVDFTPADRDEVVPLVLAFESGQEKTLLLSGSEMWTGDDFC